MKTKMKTLILSLCAGAILAGTTACTTVVQKPEPTTTTTEETHSVSTPVGGVTTQTQTTQPY